MQTTLQPLVDGSISRARAELTDAAASIRNDAARAGGDSSRTILSIFSAAIEVFDRQADRLCAALATTGLTAIGGATDAKLVALVTVLKNSTHLLGMSILAAAHELSPKIQPPEFFDRCKVPVKDAVRAKVAAQELQLRHLIESNKSSQPHGLYFAGPVGTAVIGDHNSTTITTNQGASEQSVAKLQQAIDELIAAIRLSDLEGEVVDERVEVLSSARAEIGRAKPNRFTLGGIVSNLGGLVQGVAAAPEAYRVVKEGLTALVGR